ncbi:MAG: DUF72 domain-containing protein [Thermoprotei archaeon]
MVVSVGCSGWSYKEWVGPFYVSSEKMFSQYADVFEVAEMDSTFYVVPPPSLAMGLSSSSPAKFKFLPKFNRTITHEKLLGLAGNTEAELEAFLKFLAPLRLSGKLGPCLLQLPPSFGQEKVDAIPDFLSVLPSWMRVAVEIRNTSLLSSRLISVLVDQNASYVSVDEPLLPPAFIVTADFAYVRFHGKGKKIWFDYRYSNDELEPWAKRVGSSGRLQVYALFNNHFHGYAVENALSFMKMLGQVTDSQARLLDDVSRRIDSGGSPQQHLLRRRTVIPMADRGSVR